MKIARLLAFPAAAALMLSGCGMPASQPEVRDARITLPAAPALPGAGYFELTGFDGMEVLTGASSPVAERIEIHLSSEENGVSRMQKLDEVHLPRTGEMAFSSGGHHLMVFGLSGGLQAGQTVPLTLTFRKADPVTVEARIEAPGGGGHMGH